MENQGISRVHYFERQFLRTQDFDDEQAYHLGMLRRHQVTHHSWGIVRGLDLALDPDCNPVLQPGIAVDGYGRTLVWQVGQTLPLREFDAKGSDRLDVWLAYGELKSDNAPAGYTGCGTGGDTEAYYRTQEQPVLLLEIPDPTHPDPRRPPGVPEGDLGFDGTQNPPRSASAFWPIYLGRVLRKREKAGEPWQYSISLDGRPYAGLIGEMVRHPSANAWVEIGTPVSGEGQQTRFAVFLVSSVAKTKNDLEETIEDLDPRLEITSAGQINLRGDASLNGNLVFEQGALAFRAEDSQPVAPTVDQRNQQTGPRPWSIYRARGEVQVEKMPADPRQKANSPSESKSVTNDLRLEMADHDVDGKSQVVIGTWAKGPDGKEAFQPCLTIDDDCNVTVEHNLIVKGFISQLGDNAVYSIPGGPPLSPEVKSLLVGTSTAAANANVPPPPGQPFGVTRAIDLDELIGLLDRAQVRQILLRAIMADPNLYRAFLFAFLTYAEGNVTGIQALMEALNDDPSQALELIHELLDSMIGPSLMTGIIQWDDAGQPKGINKLADALLIDPVRMSDLLRLLFSNTAALTIADDARTKIIEKILSYADWPARLADQLGANADMLASLIHAIVDGPLADIILNNKDQGKLLVGGILDSDPLMDFLADELSDISGQPQRLDRLAIRIKNALSANRPALDNFVKQLQEP
jgi:hypothetical protein